MPQHFVATHDLVKAGFEHGHIRATGEAHGDRNVIGGAVRVELVQKPETLLGERERHGVRIGPAWDLLRARRRQAFFSEQRFENARRSGDKARVRPEDSIIPGSPSEVRPPTTDGAADGPA